MTTGQGRMKIGQGHMRIDIEHMTMGQSNMRIGTKHMMKGQGNMKKGQGRTMTGHQEVHTIPGLGGEGRLITKSTCQGLRGNQGTRLQRKWNHRARFVTCY